VSRCYGARRRTIDAMEHVEWAAEFDAGLGPQP
jgi:hypothetical protein